ncbi:MAG TPA: hypothetical protein VLA98_14015 [Solirubrobacteraceae bacterium]|nr:hypothetical protein [Solirubrobacteraceae bacterium]
MTLANPDRRMAAVRALRDQGVEHPGEVLIGWTDTILLSARDDYDRADPADEVAEQLVDGTLLTTAVPDALRALADVPALAWTSSELGPFDTPAEAVLAAFRELGARLGVAEIIRLREEANPRD